MQNQYQPHLDWIDNQHNSMVDLLIAWSNINSYTENIIGLDSMLAALKSAFAPLGGEMQEISLPSRVTIDRLGHHHETLTGKALHIKKHPKAPFQVLLGGHMDTVYPLEHPFQNAIKVDPNRLRGPGTADMKGGLVVLLTALQALERSPFAGKVGWEVIINPDEEVGSQGSEHLFVEAAKRNQIGLLYEPSFSDGAIVSERKGSANFTVVFHGRAAHAGRDYFSGRNALTAAARFALAAEALTNAAEGITVNVGYMQGGGPVNIVPDRAVCGFNARMTHEKDLARLVKVVEEYVSASNAQDGISAQLFAHGARAPKPFSNNHKALFETLAACGKELGFELKTRPSGGVCDGNLLAEAGLPTIDTLGVIGGHIHTPEEYVELSSLTERAKLSAYFLMKMAEGGMR